MRTTTLVAALLLAACSANQTTEDAVVEAPQAKVITVTSDSPEAIAAFDKGRALAENFRHAEALAKYDEAIALDPEFALAHAYHGAMKQGPEGLTELRKAVELSASVPEAEGLQIKAMLAQREGDMAKSKELWTKAAEAAPDDWRAQNMLGVIAYGEQNWNGALVPLERATTLNPEAGPSWNMLGYAHAQLGEYDAAVAALEKYVATDPTEANPHDSLGEVLLMAGRFDEAEAAFTKATEVNPAFWPGYSGIAQSRFLRGDWEGGRTALGKAIGAAALPEDRVDARTHLAWSWYAQGDRAQAAATLVEAETEATGAKLDVSYTWVALERGHMATLSGDWADAITQSREGLTRAETAKLEGGELLYVRLTSNVGQVIGLSMQGKTADAEALLGPIDIDASLVRGAIDIPLVAKGAVAVGKGDTAAAIASYAQCEARDAFCLYMLVKAHEKAGDTAAAEAARDKLLSLNERGGEYLGIWSAAGGQASLAAVTSGQ